MTTKLTLIRKSRGMTQADVCRASGVDRTILCLLETGRLRPTDAQAAAVAQALRVDPAQAARLFETVELAADLTVREARR